MFRTNDVIALTYKSLECLAVAALCYFVLTFISSRLVSLWQKGSCLMENKQKILQVAEPVQELPQAARCSRTSASTFYKNEVVSIIGPSGGGKSHLPSLPEPAGDADLRPDPL